MPSTEKKRSRGADAAVWVGSSLLVLVVAVAALAGLAALGRVQFRVRGREYTIAAGAFGPRVRVQGYSASQEMPGSDLYRFGIGTGWLQVRVTAEPGPD